MGHYDSECSYCHDFGRFVREECGCAGAVAARAKCKAEAQAKLDEAFKILNELNMPNLYKPRDPESYEARDLVKVANWAKGLKK